MKTKKELKKEYKELKPQMGVFQIRNLTDETLFIGSSADIPSMWNRLRFQLEFGSFPNQELQQAWTEKGKDNFAFEVLSELEHKEDQTPDLIKNDLKDLERMVREELTANGKVLINPAK